MQNIKYYKLYFKKQEKYSLKNKDELLMIYFLLSCTSASDTIFG